MLKIVGLNKSYDKKIILNNLNLEINRGEIIGLLAPNGEGKSTLLKILGGQISFDSGEYYFEDREFTYRDKEYIGYMSDKEIMPVGWKIIDCIDYYSDNFKKFDRNKAIEMISTFKLDLNSKVKPLSKGQNEKLHLALALSIKGSLYILDEPLAAIDLLAREELIKMILENFDEESTIIISSHLVSDIERMLDRVILMRNGDVVRNRLVEDLREEGKSVVKLYKEVYGNAIN